LLEAWGNTEFYPELHADSDYGAKLIICDGKAPVDKPCDDLRDTSFRIDQG
jgi:hypothetical protein